MEPRDEQQNGEKDQDSAPQGDPKKQDSASHGEQKKSDSAPQGQVATAERKPPAGAQVVGADDPAIMTKPVQYPDWAGHPDRTDVIETSRIQGPNETFNHNFVLVPVETDRPRHEKSSANGNDHGHKGNDAKDEHGKKESGDQKHDDSDPKDKHRQPARQGPSLTRILLYAGLVSLVCGVIGAFGYSYFFGSSKSSDQKSSGKDSGSSKDSDSSKGSDSDSSKSSDSSKKDSNSGKLAEAQKAWMTAVKALRDARKEEHSARRSEDEAKAILNFLRNTLLSAGRPGDASLSDAFWAAGQGKDPTLRKALDLTEAQIADAFTDRPLAEASVRELLATGYMSLGDAPQAVKQYERALALREAMLGVNDADTAECRNQLAVAYRLADRSGEGGKLFERNPDSPAHAAALEARGSMLLMQKKPADAELKLRECLKIRQKKKPDDWMTFDTKSMLGEALLDQNKLAEAEPLLLSGYEGLEEHKDAIPPTEKHRIKKAAGRVVRLYEAWHQPQKAMQWRGKKEANEHPLEAP